MDLSSLQQIGTEARSVRPSRIQSILLRTGLQFKEVGKDAYIVQRAAFPDKGTLAYVP